MRLDDNPLTSVLEKLFSYLTCQKNHLAKLDVVSSEMDETFIGLMVEMNKYLFGELERSKSNARSNIMPYSQVNDGIPENCLISRAPVNSQLDSNQTTHEAAKTKFRSSGLAVMIKNGEINVAEENCGTGSNDKLIEEESRANRNHRSVKDADHLRCKVCRFTCKRSNTMKAHILNVHTNNTVYKCPVCSKSYKSVTSLQAHYEKFHITYDGEIDEVCKTSATSSANGLKELEESRDSREALTKKRKLNKMKDCKIVARKIDSSGSIKSNKYATKTVPKHVCKICGRRYSKRSYLKDHMPSHTGEKPVKCMFCGMRFMNRGKRLSHYKKVHKDEYSPSKVTRGSLALRKTNISNSKSVTLQSVPEEVIAPPESNGVVAFCENAETVQNQQSNSSSAEA